MNIHFLLDIFFVREIGLTELQVIKVLMAAFLGVLFTQSGLDKAFDYKENLDYFMSHFKDSPLRNMVGWLMPVITILEISAGILSSIGAVLLFFKEENIAFAGNLLGALSVLALFFGQRVAKDYNGAAVLVPYFFLCVFGLYLYLA